MALRWLLGNLCHRTKASVGRKEEDEEEVCTFCSVHLVTKWHMTWFGIGCTWMWATRVFECEVKPFMCRQKQKIQSHKNDTEARHNSTIIKTTVYDNTRDCHVKLTIVPTCNTHKQRKNKGSKGVSKRSAISRFPVRVTFTQSTHGLYALLFI